LHKTFPFTDHVFLSISLSDIEVVSSLFKITSIFNMYIDTKEPLNTTSNIHHEFKIIKDNN